MKVTSSKGHQKQPSCYPPAAAILVVMAFDEKKRGLPTGYCCCNGRLPALQRTLQRTLQKRMEAWQSNW